ncbi:Nucleoside-diphosphate-sugar epimerase [Filimonas lacunae]|uniref:Nucleoside-diphosphate-sugar epimerase n=1 Tax=Filimonas lacunae TaxID=477680 RepID=A0A173MI47_9BACT|nr:SDR family oxidoreductase [Filimonas lacunae]BAV07156.1 hypothetical protein YeeZ precursor [Filimonas lacunae]SIS94164.1 Nucleoside-diphosphate-sugar epimerase [Filimonas lacunae]
MTPNTTISILGCGWLGLPLAQAFIQEDFTVKGSTTSADKLTQLTAAGIIPYLLPLPSPDNITPDTAIFQCDILFIAIPPKVRSGKGDDYLAAMREMLPFIRQQAIAHVVFISSTSVYGNVNGMITEETPASPDTQSGHILVAAEQLFAQETSFTTTIIRFAGLAGPERHPGRFLAAKLNVPGGLLPVNLIHLTDCIGICKAIVQQQAFGHIFNACAPHHPTKKEFYQAAAVSAGLTPPTFTEEPCTGKTISSIQLERLHYRFVVDNWFNWL